MTAVLAHRGASRAERENTVAAFRAAGRMGADAVELDVRRTADGALVVHHDAVLGPDHPIVAAQAADLPHYVPSLDAALDACVGMWVNVEIKNDAEEPDFDPTDSIADLVVEALRRRGEPDRWLISSFRLETVDRCRALAPEIPTAWLTMEVHEGVAAELAELGHRALHPWYRNVTEEVVRACHERGVQVNAWTCDDPIAMRRLAGWGVDGICTNVPDVALQALGR
jgi:glycerophosphoryl diester phosphodiesterase